MFFNNPLGISSCQSWVPVRHQNIERIGGVFLILAQSQLSVFFIEKAYVFRPMIVRRVVGKMKHEPKLYAFIAPRCMVLHQRVLFVQRLSPADNPIKVLSREAVFIINAPNLTLGNLILFDIPFSLTNHTHCFCTTTLQSMIFLRYGSAPYLPSRYCLSYLASLRTISPFPVLNSTREYSFEF